MKFTAIGVELLPAFNTPPSALESFTLHAVARENTVVYTINAGPVRSRFSGVCV